MTVAEFLENFNHAPYNLYEIAELLSEVTDDLHAAQVASQFLTARDNLEVALDSMGWETG